MKNAQIWHRQEQQISQDIGCHGALCVGAGFSVSGPGTLSISVTGRGSSVSGPAAPCVRSRRFLCRRPAHFVSGPGALCVGARRSLCGDRRSLPPCVGPRRSLCDALRALCVGARRSLCRGPAFSLCDALALFVSGPDALSLSLSLSLSGAPAPSLSGLYVSSEVCTALSCRYITWRLNIFGLVRWIFLLKYFC